MIDQDILALLEQTPDRTLDGLEADIWNRVAMQTRTQRTVVLCQTLAIALALTGGLTAGTLTAESAQAHRLVFVSAGGALAPSTLLLGSRP